MIKFNKYNGYRSTSIVVFLLNCKRCTHARSASRLAVSINKESEVLDDFVPLSLFSYLPNVLKKMMVEVCVRYDNKLYINLHGRETCSCNLKLGVCDVYIRYQAGLNLLYR